MVKTMLRQAIPLQPTEVHRQEDSHLQPMEDSTPKQVDVPEGGCDPLGCPRWSKLLAGPVDQCRGPCWSRFAGRTCDPTGGPTLEQPVPERPHPVGRTRIGEGHEEPPPVRRTHAGAGAECEESSPGGGRSSREDE